LASWREARHRAIRYKSSPHAHPALLWAFRFYPLPKFVYLIKATLNNARPIKVNLPKNN
jgi:hypothetical protein